MINSRFSGIFGRAADAQVTRLRRRTGTSRPRCEGRGAGTAGAQRRGLPGPRCALPARPRSARCSGHAGTPLPDGSPAPSEGKAAGRRQGEGGWEAPRSGPHPRSLPAGLGPLSARPPPPASRCGFPGLGRFRSCPGWAPRSPPGSPQRGRAGLRAARPGEAVGWASALEAGMRSLPRGGRVPRSAPRAAPGGAHRSPPSQPRGRRGLARRGRAGAAQEPRRPRGSPAAPRRLSRTLPAALRAPGPGCAGRGRSVGPPSGRGALPSPAPRGSGRVFPLRTPAVVKPGICPSTKTAPTSAVPARGQAPPAGPAPGAARGAERVRSGAAGSCGRPGPAAPPAQSEVSPTEQTRIDQIISDIIIGFN